MPSFMQHMLSYPSYTCRDRASHAIFVYFCQTSHAITTTRMCPFHYRSFHFPKWWVRIAFLLLSPPLVYDSYDVNIVTFFYYYLSLSNICSVQFQRPIIRHLRDRATAIIYGSQESHDNFMEHNSVFLLQ